MNKVLLVLTNVLFLVSSLTACGGGGGGGGSTGGSTTPIANAAPNAIIVVAKTTGYAPLTLEFDGSTSSDSDGSIASYTWHTGDGNSYAGSTITHTYEGLGTFAATLTVTDDDGASQQRSVSIDVYARIAGQYFGDYSLSSSVTGTEYGTNCLIGSNHQAYCALYNHSTGETSSYLSGSINVIEDIVTGTLLAEARPGYVLVDGSELGDMSIEATVIPREQIVDGVYFGAGDTGLIDNIPFDYVLDFPVNISEIEGTWRRSYDDGIERVMTIDSTGAFSVSESDGCTFSGQFSPMDPNLNEFEIRYYLDTSVCPAQAGSGERIGLASLDTYYDSEDWLWWRVTFQEGDYAGRIGGGSVARPRASGSVGGDLQKPQQPVAQTWLIEMMY